MKGRKSARGSSVQSRPVQDPDVLTVQVEALCQQSAQLTVGARVAEWLAQLDYAAPFAAAGRALRLAPAGDEVGVVLGSHGSQVSSAARHSSVKCSTKPLISVKRDCDIIHRISWPMSHLRQAAPAGSQYITPEGARRLRLELELLWRDERPRVCQAVAAAAAQGDRSENAEYTYGKRRLREIDRRVRFLRRRLAGMVVVDQPPADPARVFFGAWVLLESQDGAQSRYRIVGPDEFDRAPGYISMDSPLGRALLRKTLDDEVIVEAPGGSRAYVIVSIEYPRDSP